MKHSVPDIKIAFHIQLIVAVRQWFFIFRSDESCDTLLSYELPPGFSTLTHKLFLNACEATNAGELGKSVKKKR